MVLHSFGDPQTEIIEAKIAIRENGIDLVIVVDFRYDNQEDFYPYGKMR
jgi:hypothetical protein